MLFFDPENSTSAGSDWLLVSFDEGLPGDPADDEWTVRTQDPPNDKAQCTEDGRVFHMPFEMTIRWK
jgi:hypothetical protein